MNAFSNRLEKLQRIITDRLLEVAALLNITEHCFGAVLVGNQCINRIHIVAEVTLPCNMFFEFAIEDALVGSILFPLCNLVEEFRFLLDWNLRINVLLFHLTKCPCNISSIIILLLHVVGQLLLDLLEGGILDGLVRCHGCELVDHLGVRILLVGLVITTIGVTVLRLFLMVSSHGAGRDSNAK